VCDNLPSPKVKFIGVLLDPNLNFGLHINFISAKISNSLYQLTTAKNISQKALTMLNYSLIHSHLTYAIHVWSCTSNNILKRAGNKAKDGHMYYT
jgi:hypothetical protein